MGDRPEDVSLSDILTPDERRSLAGGQEAGHPQPPAGVARSGTPAGQTDPEAGPRSAAEPVAAAGQGEPEAALLLAVEDGRVRFIPGRPGGERPVIEPGPNVNVYVNGVALNRPRRIDLGDEIVLEPATVAPETKVSVNLSGDLMEAWLTVQRRPGQRYVVEDHPPTTRLQVRARLVEEQPAPAPTVEEVQKALQSAGVRFGLKAEAIRQALESPSGEPVLVAEGIRPTMPEDGRIEPLFEEREAPHVDLEAERVDLFERGAITWVEPGQVVAICHPARPGSPGTNVLGKPVPVTPPKAVFMKAGKGVRLSEDGRSAVAEVGGRPVLSGTTVSVVPVYEVAGDADVKTGHLRFTGDIHVRGDVLDNVEVQAGGELRVGGLLSRARVRAGGAVSVGRTIVGSEVEAGGQAALVQEVLPVLASLASQLGRLVPAALQLRQEVVQLQPAPSPGSAGGPLRLSDGELVKRLLERKFWEIPKLARRLGELGDRLQSLSPMGQRVADRAARLLVGSGPLRMGSLAELEELTRELEDLQQSIEAQSTQEADVTAYGILNSRVEASGRIVIRGSGAFNSTLAAGKGVEARRGVIRGGQVTVVEGEVVARELGGSSGVHTAISVVRAGRVLASLVHPNVVVTITGQRHVFDEGARALRAYMGPDGRLVVERLKAQGFRRPDRGVDGTEGEEAWR